MWVLKEDCEYCECQGKQQEHDRSNPLLQEFHGSIVGVLQGICRSTMAVLASTTAVPGQFCRSTGGSKPSCSHTPVP